MDAAPVAWAFFWCRLPGPEGSSATVRDRRDQCCSGADFLTHAKTDIARVVISNPEVATAVPSPAAARSTFLARRRPANVAVFGANEELLGTD